jgi:hypothetical protein
MVTYLLDTADTESDLEEELRGFAPIGILE